MILIKVVTAIYLGAALFAAHAINIRGTVVNSQLPLPKEKGLVKEPSVD